MAPFVLPAVESVLPHIVLHHMSYALDEEIGTMPKEIRRTGWDHKENQNMFSKRLSRQINPYFQINTFSSS